MGIYDLARFQNAQEQYFEIALQELQSAKKQSHWIWYIFPQFAGLGRSSTSCYYAIQSREEAIAYLNTPSLHDNLVEVCQVILSLADVSASDIFGSLDAKKVKSCMTLFAEVTVSIPEFSYEHQLFEDVLAYYFYNKRDYLTLKLLNNNSLLQG